MHKLNSQEELVHETLLFIIIYYIIYIYIKIYKLYYYKLKIYEHVNAIDPTPFNSYLLNKHTSIKGNQIIKECSCLHTELCRLTGSRQRDND